MKRILVSLLVLSCASVAGAANIAFWHFNDTTDLNPNSTTDILRLNPLGTEDAKTEYMADVAAGGIAASLRAWGTFGSQPTGTLVGTNGHPTSQNDNFGAYGGTTLNDISLPQIAGGALAITGMANNDKSIVLAFGAAGYWFEDVVLSYATRGTSTGYGTHAIAYSNDGISWTPFSNVTANKTSTWSVTTVNLGSAFAVAPGSDPTRYIRITVSGATSASGNNRFDNMLITGNPVPEPASAILLLGLGCLMAIRRR